MTTPGLAPDFRDLLRCLLNANAQFVVVGAHAMAAHGVPRSTGDLDVLVKPDAENAARVVLALREFGAPLDAHGVRADDFTVPGTVYQLGLPPNRIDLLTEISGVPFGVAWGSRIEVAVEGMPVPFLGREALVANKRATGREKDLVDLKLLERGR